jgi:hypothetical protein
MIVHATDDWDGTLCDLGIDEVRPPDTIISDSFSPADKAPAHAPCPACYPDAKATV